MRLLYVAPDAFGSNARSLYDALLAVGVDGYPIDSAHTDHARRFSYQHLRRRVTGRRSPSVLAAFRAHVLATARRLEPDAVLVVRPMWLDDDAARQLAEMSRLVHMTFDDIANPVNSTPDYRTALGRCHLSITTREPNIGDLRDLGVPRVLRLAYSYDRRIHLPVPAPTNEWDLCFIGSYRPARAEVLAQVARTTTLRLRVAGDGWWRRRLPGADVTPARYGLEMSEIMGRSALTLGFLNHENRDRQNPRSYEVTACGGVLCAERTEEHTALYDEGTEALFFDDAAELIDLAHTVVDDRERIAALRDAGRAKVLGLDATYEDRARRIIAEIDSL